VVAVAVVVVVAPPNVIMNPATTNGNSARRRWTAKSAITAPTVHATNTTTARMNPSDSEKMKNVSNGPNSTAKLKMIRRLRYFMRFREKWVRAHWKCANAQTTPTRRA
jgi:hypothetical protein